MALMLETGIQHGLVDLYCHVPLAVAQALLGPCQYPVGHFCPYRPDFQWQVPVSIVRGLSLHADWCVAGWKCHGFHAPASNPNQLNNGAWKMNTPALSLV